MTAGTPPTPGMAIPSREVLLPFAVFILFVGGSPVAMRITYAEMAPFWMGLTRFGLGAIVFWGLAIYKRLEIPKGRTLLGPVLYGALGIGISFILLAWGLVETSASLAAILLAMVPLMTVFLSAFQGVEALARRSVFGSLLAIAGTAITVVGAPSGDVSLPHISALLIGTVFLAQSGVVIKRFPPTHPFMTNAVAMSVGALILALASLIAGEAWIIPSQSSTWTALAYLTIFVTIFSFLLYLQVLNKWTASGASYGFVVIPLVTFVVAAVLTGEQITPNFLLGAIFVLAGVAVGALLPGKQDVEAVDECKDTAGQILPRCN